MNQSNIFKFIFFHEYVHEMFLFQVKNLFTFREAERAIDMPTRSGKGR